MKIQVKQLSINENLVYLMTEDNQLIKGEISSIKETKDVINKFKLLKEKYN